jgi:hypothetical protein
MRVPEESWHSIAMRSAVVAWGVTTAYFWLMFALVAFIGGFLGDFYSDGYSGPPSPDRLTLRCSLGGIWLFLLSFGAVHHVAGLPGGGRVVGRMLVIGWFAAAPLLIPSWSPEWWPPVRLSGYALTLLLILSAIYCRKLR